MNNKDPGPRSPDYYYNDHKYYVVYLISENKEDEVNRIKLAQKIFTLLGKKCLGMHKISRSTMKITFEDKETANDLIKQQPIKGLKAYIPYNIKYVVGVVQDIETDITDEEIVELFGGKIYKAYRIFRFDRTQDKRVPTKSVKIEIDAEELPAHLYVYGMRVKVFEFVQKPRTCFKCLKCGHFKDKCRSAIEKCRNCGQLCEERCEKQKMCTSCGDKTHCFGDKDCAIYKIEEDVIRVMSVNKLSYFEARDWIRENASGEAYSLALLEFPTMDEQ